METNELYNSTDITKVREFLLREQKNKDALTGLIIPDKQAVLDHDHNTQYVRAVLHRQVNAALGKIENVYLRYLSYWYEGDLADFLDQVAEYIRRPDDKRWYHPHWLKKANAEFNKLNAAGMDKVLELMKLGTGKNNAERRALFNKGLLTRTYKFDIILKYIEKGRKC